MSSDRLRPVDGELYVIRWERLDGRDVKHRYFRRYHDAEAFRAKLAAVGRRVRMYDTHAVWRRR